MSPPKDIEALSPTELKSLVLKLLEEQAEFRRTIGALRDEIARLKGGPGRPDIKANVKPSGMEKASEAQPSDPSGERRRRGGTRAKLTIDEERKLEADAPSGSRFKGYASFLVQDLMIRPFVTDFLRERWQTPDGKTVMAPLPPGVEGHFGPELRRFVLAQHHQGQVTAARLVTLLRGFGVVISKRQVVRLLIAGKQSFLDEARAVLRAGLTNAGWITADDTGARHKGKNGFCTQIGNAHFTYFATTGSKSRLNFLELLRAGHDDYVVNEEALAYMRGRALAGPVVARLSEHPDRIFADRAAWNVHLDRLGVSALKVSPDPVLVASEGALWGSVKAHGLLANAVIVSDDAGQFNVGLHGLCWAHSERLVHKLDTFTEAQRAAQQRIRGLIWLFYNNLKAWRRHPSPARKAVLSARFDRIFGHKTGFASLDRLLGRQRANRNELLIVLERPDVPLNTNGSENDIRCQVTKREISGGTRSDAGRDCRDAFLGLLKTCAKNGILFWDYLGARLKVPGCRDIPDLAQILAALAPRPPLRAQDFRPLAATRRYARLGLGKTRPRTTHSGPHPGVR